MSKLKKGMEVILKESVNGVPRGTHGVVATKLGMRWEVKFVTGHTTVVSRQLLNQAPVDQSFGVYRKLKAHEVQAAQKCLDSALKDGIYLVNHSTGLGTEPVENLCKMHVLENTKRKMTAIFLYRDTPIVKQEVILALTGEYEGTVIYKRDREELLKLFPPVEMTLAAANA